MDIEQLEQIFESFCAFGSSRNMAASNSNIADSTSNLNGSVMDNQKFAKFARETKIINPPKVTSVDVDNAFMKVKPRTGRKIDFDGFQKALRILAEKRYPRKDSEEAYLSLVNHVCQSKGPKLHSVQPEATGVFEKLTDTKLYTGAHKARFDEHGVGRGAAGQVDAEEATRNLSTIVSRDPATKQKRAISQSAEVLTGKPAEKRYSATPASNEDLAAAGSDQGRPSSRSEAVTPRRSAGAGGKSKEKNVFDRLTDTKGYRGTHAQRFDEQGKGRGLAGRDSVSKGAAPGTYHGGDVKDLSQILRT